MCFIWKYVTWRQLLVLVETVLESTKDVRAETKKWNQLRTRSEKINSIKIIWNSRWKVCSVSKKSWLLLFLE